MALQNALMRTQQEEDPQVEKVLCFTVSWAPADFSATSSKYEMLVFVSSSLNLNYITKEEPSRRKRISAGNDSLTMDFKL